MPYSMHFEHTQLFIGTPKYFDNKLLRDNNIVDLKFSYYQFHYFILLITAFHTN